MTGFDINDNNDIFLDADGNLALVKDIEAVKVAVLCQTRTTYGEVILNTKAGIPYFQTIFIAHPDIELWKKYMKDTILAIPKILGISNFKTYIDYGTNLLQYAIVINTEYGQGVING